MNTWGGEVDADVYAPMSLFFFVYFFYNKNGLLNFALCVSISNF